MPNTLNYFSRGNMHPRLVLGTLLMLASIFGFESPGRAAGVVTNASYAALKFALTGGGPVTFTNDATIVVSNTLGINFSTSIDASGHNVTLSGNNSNRVFNVASGVTLIITNVTIANGRTVGANGATGATGNDGTSTGQNGGNGGNGSDGTGGAILNSGNLALFNCVLQSNSTVGGNGGTGGTGGNGGFNGGNGGNGGIAGNGLGGAIYNIGTLLLTNCTLSGNTATGGNGGLGGTNGNGPSTSYVGGGGLGATGQGAVIYNGGTTVTIINCTFSGNTAQGGTSQTAGTSSANPSVGLAGFVGADGRGGAFCNVAGASGITNCTFDANFAIGGAGGNGGLGNATGGNGGNGGNGFGGSLYNSATLVVVNCTLHGGAANGGTNGFSGAGPFAGSKGKVGLSKGDLIGNNGGFFEMENSIVTRGLNGDNAFGTITDLGHNISSDGTPVFTDQTSRLHTVANLLSLADNGGPTLTMALQPGSPALDAGNNDACLPFDQRGFTRPAGSGCDIGAYEFGNEFSISGRVTFGTNGMPGVVLTLSGPATNSTTSDAGGNYSFVNLPGGTYTVIPQPSGTFSSTNSTVTIGPPVSNVNFAANAIGGQVTSGTNLMRGITLNLTGPVSGTTLSDTNGNYLFTNLLAGTYTVATQSTTNFISTNSTVTIPPAAFNVNFAAANGGVSTNGPGTATISGSAGSNVAVTFSGLATNQTYRIQASTNLTTWQDVATNNSGVTGSIVLSQSKTNLPRQFFRSVKP
jgi:hypothetical protein